MMITIAIIALIAFVAGILWDLISVSVVDYPSPRLGIAAIGTCAWWEISLPLAICILVLGIAWLAVFLKPFSVSLRRRKKTEYQEKMEN